MRSLTSLGVQGFFAVGLLILGALSPAHAMTGGVIVISEIMYNPQEGGQDLEYIEIVNRQPNSVDLSGWFFSRGINFTFPDGTWLDGGRYLVICANEEAVKAKYGIENTIGNWAACDDSGSGGCALANGGERIELSEPSGVPATSVRYNDRGMWPSGADGAGPSLELVDIYFDYEDAANWRLSSALGGSPGKPNEPDVGVVPVALNEAYLGTDGDRWVELYNKSDEPVDISGFHLTDDRDVIDKSKIPDGTVLAPRGFKVFTETELGLDFTPVAVEEEDPRQFIALTNADASRVIDARIFEYFQDGVSEARFPDGGLDFSDHAEPTREAANRLPVETEVVINEVMYHPWNKDLNGEYVEIFNRSDREIDLTGWSFTRGVNFDFPEGTKIGPGQYLVIARNPAHIRDVYGLSNGVVLGPNPDDADAVDDFGRLRDDGEEIILRDQNRNIADIVRYHDGGEWPLWADGGGPSMELIDVFQNNNVGVAWDASDDTADKSEVQEIAYTGTFSTTQPEFHIGLTHRGITLVDDIRIFQREIVFVPSQVFVEVGEEWRYFKGTSEPSTPREAWRDPDFNDSQWAVGKSPFGFGEDDLIGPEGTTFDDMRKQDENPGYTSVFLRKEFNVADPAAIGSLAFTAILDDGLILYLNGTRVHIENMSGTDEEPLDTFDETARRSREKLDVTVDLTDRKDLLKPGRNVLAAQLHNSTITNSDLLLIPRLMDGEFAPRDSESALSNGDFEEPIVRGLRPGGWLIEGTHSRSGPTTEGAISGTTSLKVVATAKGDNKVNRLEATLPAIGRGEYTVEFKAKWLVGAPNILTHGHNTAGAQFDIAKSSFLGVPLNLGTPGAVNSVTLRQIERAGSANLGPVISEVSHTPVTPTADEDVQLVARVEDPDGIKSVTVHFWREDTRGLPGPDSIAEVAMSGPDSDGFFSATIPGGSLRTRTVFFLTATDTGDRVGRFPLDKPSRTHAMTLDPADAPITDESFLVYRHDTPARPGNPRWHSYRFWMPYRNEIELQRQKLLSNDRYEGTFIFNNDYAYYNARTRHTGSPWARAGMGGSYRVYTPKDQPLHGSQFLKNFNMEDHQRGGSRSVLERLSHYLIRHNGGNIKVPYSFQWLVQWQMNDRINTAREHITAPNRQFIDYWYPEDDDGHMFEVDDRFEINDGGTRQSSIDARWTYPPMRTGDGDDPENYRWFFNTRLNKGFDDYQPLIETAKVLDNRLTRDDEFDETVWEHIDVENMLRVWAIRMNTDDWDTWGTDRGKNCYVYRSTDVGGTWSLFAWDMELTYNNVGAFMPPPINRPYTTINQGKFPEVVRLINRPEIKRMYYGIMKDMLDHQFQSRFLAPFTVRVTQLGMNNTDRMRPGGWIDQRARSLSGVLRSATAPLVDFEILTNDGEPFVSTEPQVRIEGRAPVEVRFVVATVDGEDPGEATNSVTFPGPDPLRWKTDLTLSEGPHTIDFFAFTDSGDIFGIVSIDVAVSTSGVVVQSVDPSQAFVGDLVTITGQGLEAGATVWFGDVQATEVDASGAPTTLVARVPQMPAGTVDLVVRVGEVASIPVSIEIMEPTVDFIRGDADLDTRVNLTDALVVLRYLFQAGEMTCLDAGDADDSGALNLSDAIYILNYLFLAGPTPKEPFPERGADPTDDELGCETGL